MKRVIETKETIFTVDLTQIDQHKIYASTSDTDVYKLHVIDNKWCFCGLRNSLVGSTGIHNSAEFAIRREMGYVDVYEFDTQREFLEWALQNTK